MPVNSWFITLLFALILMAICLGVFGFFKYSLEVRGAQPDNSFWFLTVLLFIALLSISSFVAFIFLHGMR